MGLSMISWRSSAYVALVMSKGTYLEISVNFLRKLRENSSLFGGGVDTRSNGHLGVPDDVIILILIRPIPRTESQSLIQMRLTSSRGVVFHWQGVDWACYVNPFLCRRPGNQKSWGRGGCPRCIQSVVFFNFWIQILAVKSQYQYNRYVWESNKKKLKKMNWWS